nr:cytochrome c biogenesis heme-transporting ATPase CcmA [Teredinibacter waterburyi]
MVECSLSLNGLSCEREERVLFENLSARFEPGSISQIAGPNGAGKTTLLRLIAGLSQPQQGSIEWGDHSSSDPKQRNLGRLGLHSALLYFGHHPAVNPSLTALENLEWYFGLNGCKQPSVAEDADQATATIPSNAEYLTALQAVGLAGYDQVQCQNMSAGQQRRIALARLYLSRAPLWILDEPFTAIDKQGVAELENCIAQHAARGGVIILTTHQPLALANVHVLDLAEFEPKSLSTESKTVGEVGL